MSDILDRVRPELRELSAYGVPHPERIVAKLDANESPFGLPTEVAEALGNRLAEVSLHRYPPADCGALRALLAARHGVDPDALLFGNGSDELITMLLSTFAAPRPGRQRASCLYPGPTFGVYRLACIWCGVDPVEVPLDDEFQLDEPALERALGEHRPNIVFFARPNNPTGTLWSREVVLRTAERNPDVLVVHDEAYGDYGGDSMTAEVERLPNLLVMRTLSKIGMAGLRVGYLYAAPRIIHEVDKLRPPYNIGALNQAAAFYLLDRHDDLIRAHCAEVAAARDQLHAALSELPGIRTYPSAANLLLIRITDRNANDVWRDLCDRGVLVRNVSDDGALAGCLRVTVGTADENRTFLEALRAVL